MLSMAVSSISVLCLSVAPSIQIFMILIFMVGFGLSGYETIIYVYVTEISGTFLLKTKGLRYRNISVNVLFMVWALS